MKSRRRVLLSCFTCSPLLGSEPGVGWCWLLEIAKRHDVVLVTHAYYRAHLEPALTVNPIEGLEIYYYTPPAFGLDFSTQLNSRLFYIWWQWNLKRYVKQLLKTQSFDLIHHLTWGTFRFPTFLGRMGIPLVMGPLGGGEVAPLRCYEGLPFQARAFEWVRYVSLYLVRFDPLATWGPRASALILCKTEHTAHALPVSLRDRAVITPEQGSPAIDISHRQSRSTTSFRLLFAARLLGWKGIALALGAMRSLLNAGHDVTLDVVGDGSLRAQVMSEIARLGLTERVRMLGMLPRPKLLELYGQADLFLFPSLHDSSGTVVLESLSRGVPVVCLDLGGPKYYVTDGCGVIVSTHEKSRAEIEQGLADAIAGLINNPERLCSMSEEALRQATIQTWEARVTDAYEAIEKKLGW